MMNPGMVCLNWKQRRLRQGNKWRLARSSPFPSTYRQGSVSTSPASSLVTRILHPRLAGLLSEPLAVLTAISLFQLEFRFRKQDIKWLTESLEGLKTLTRVCFQKQLAKPHLRAELLWELLPPCYDQETAHQVRKLTPQPLSPEPPTSVMSTLATWWLCILSLSIHDSKSSSYVSSSDW